MTLQVSGGIYLLAERRKLLKKLSSRDSFVSFMLFYFEPRASFARGFLFCLNKRL